MDHETIVEMRNFARDCTKEKMRALRAVKKAKSELTDKLNSSLSFVRNLANRRVEIYMESLRLACSIEKDAKRDYAEAIESLAWDCGFDVWAGDDV